MAAKLESTVPVIVVVAKETEEEACKNPATWKGAATVEEAEEIKPDRLESPLTPRVLAMVTEDEAWIGPAT